MTLERAKFTPPERMTEADLPQRYQQPGIFTTAGGLDRRHEGEHVVRMRDKQREAIEAVADQQKNAIVFGAWMENRAHVLADVKWQLLRNETESNSVSGENPILRAQCAMLDDEFLQDARARFHNWK